MSKKKKKGVGGFEFRVDGEEEEISLETKVYEEPEKILDKFSYGGDMKHPLEVLKKVLTELYELRNKKNIKTLDLIEEIRNIRIRNFFKLDPSIYNEENHELRVDRVNPHWRNDVFGTLDLNMRLYGWTEAYGILKYKNGVSDQRISNLFSEHIETLKEELGNILMYWKTTHMRKTKVVGSKKEGYSESLGLEWDIEGEYRGDGK